MLRGGSPPCGERARRRHLIWVVALVAITSVAARRAARRGGSRRLGARLGVFAVVALILVELLHDRLVVGDLLGRVDIVVVAVVVAVVIRNEPAHGGGIWR